MRGLTIHQPWAWAIAAGAKRVENRTWPTRYRGRIAIHAGVSRDRLGVLERFAALYGVAPPPASSLIYGAIVATAELVGCHRRDDLPADWRDDPFAEGPYCWRLADVRPLRRHIFCRGMQGLWSVSLDILEDFSRDGTPYRSRTTVGRPALNGGIPKKSSTRALVPVE